MKLRTLCALALAWAVISSGASATSIGEAKTAGPGWNGYLQGFVTAVFPDYGCMVIEESNRSAAIVVRPLVFYDIGVEVSAQGTIQSDGTFLQTRVSPTGFSQSVFPVAMSNKALTGVVGNAGLSNTDLYVTTWGKVLDYRTPYPDGSIRFHISDGTARPNDPTVALSAGGLPQVVTQTQVFEDNFNSGRKPEWVDAAEPTTAQNGVLVAAATTSSNLVYVSGLSLQDAKVTVDATAGVQMGVLLRYQDGNNFVLAFFTPAEQPTGWTLGIHERVNGQWGDWLSPVPAPGLTGTAHMTASVIGATVNVTITDGARTYSTSTGLSQLQGAGLVGLYHDVSKSLDPVSFDNFVAYQLGTGSGISANAVQVTIPQSVSGVYPVVPGNFVKVTGIAGKGETLSGDIREVMVGVSTDFARIPVGGEIIEKGLFPPVVAALDDSGDYGPSTPGTHTCGLQEAINYCVAHNRDLYIRGSGCYYAYGIGETLRIPAAKRFRIEGAMNVLQWSGDPNTADDMLVIDSAKDCHYHIGFLIYAPRGHGTILRYKPQTAIPNDGTVGIVDSDFRYECVTNCSAFSVEQHADTGVFFDTSSGPILNNEFYFIAVLNLNMNLYVPDTGYPFAYNRLQRGSIHTNGTNSTLMHLGAVAYQNEISWFTLSGDQGVTGITGIDVYGSNNRMNFSYGGGFPANRELIFEPTASGNQVTIQQWQWGQNPLDGITDLAMNPTNQVNWIGAPAPITTVTVSASPFAYTQRLYPATVRITGGNVLSVILNRSSGGSITCSTSPSNIMMSVGDQLVITASGSPTITVLPLAL